MEEILQKPVKIRKLFKKLCSKSLKPTRKVLVALRKPLTTKAAVELLIKGTLKRKVCRYCLNIAFPLSDLDQCLSIGGRGALYKVSIRDMIASFHPFKVVDDPNLPNKICPKCINQALQAYLFAQQCEQAERALRNCFDDMYDKMQRLDPLEPIKKRGRQKDHPNHNVLYTEHAKVIDYAEPIRNLINSGSVSVTDEETEMSKLECKKCWQVLPDVESLVNHEKIHPKTMWYHCRLCGQSFVKLLHIRNHLKTEHSGKEQAQPANQTFMCKQCSFTSEDHNTHLQHIEKHKFKNVMEHLVERKMEELCSVCLDKGALQNLEKTIYLHGAYPELTGNRSLYNILGSTIPEKENHKYKELLVPSYANVLTITKKAKNNTFIECDQTEKPNLNTFTISTPFIVSKESVDDKDMYLFILSEPKILSPNTFTVEEKKDDKVDESLKKNGNHNVDIKTLKMYAHDFENVNLNVFMNDIDFKKETGVNRVTEDKSASKVKKQDINEMNNGSKTCKFCWVFKKAGQCDVCKKEFLIKSIDTKTAKHFEYESDNPTIDSDIAMVTAIGNSRTAYSEENPKECNLCWVFKTTGKCGYCNTSFKNTFTKTEAIFDTVYTSKNLDNIEENKAQKRKTDETSNKINSKKARWECSICLTANDNNRDVCICCDANVLKDDLLKINFGSNKTFFEGIHETSKKLHLYYTDTANDIKTNEVTKHFTNNCNKNMKFNANNNDTHSLKINFGSSKTFVEGIYETSKKLHPYYTDTTIDIKTNEVTKDFTHNSNENMKFNASYNDTFSILDQTITTTNDNSNEMQCSDNFETPNEKLYVSKVHQEDAMDFEDIDSVRKPTSPLEIHPYPPQFISSATHFTPNPIQNNTFNFLTPVTTVQSFFNSQPKPFQFNIGSLQDRRPVRRKRPLRRSQ